MGFFAKLFGKKKSVEVFDYVNNKLVIDYYAAGITINGKVITLPTDISAFDFLGEARKVKTKAGINYSWDEAGVYCYTRNKGKVHCFGIALKKGELELETTPHKFYAGEVTINGRSWEEVVAQGEQTEFFMKALCGGYSVVAEFCQFMDPSAYSNLEIQREQ